MSKIIAIDFGLKRTGLAISDENKTFAFGLKTIQSIELEKVLSTLLLSENIEEIVLGEPKKLNLEDAHVTQNVYLLQKSLNERFPTVKISLYDERFTSKMAVDSFKVTQLKQKKAKEKQLIDEVSAVILLQDYLQYLSNKH